MALREELEEVQCGVGDSVDKAGAAASAEVLARTADARNKVSHLVSPFGRKFKRPDVNRFVQEHTKEASPEEAIKILLSDITSIQNIAESTDNDLYDPEVARECRAYKSTLCTNDEKGVLDLGLKEIKPMIEFIEENA